MSIAIRYPHDWHMARYTLHNNNNNQQCEEYQNKIKSAKKTDKHIINSRYQ